MARAPGARHRSAVGDGDRLGERQLGADAERDHVLAVGERVLGAEDRAQSLVVDVVARGGVDALAAPQREGDLLSVADAVGPAGDVQARGPERL